METKNSLFSLMLARIAETNKKRRELLAITYTLKCLMWIVMIINMIVSFSMTYDTEHVQYLIFFWGLPIYLIADILGEKYMRQNLEMAAYLKVITDSENFTDCIKVTENNFSLVKNYKDLTLVHQIKTYLGEKFSEVDSTLKEQTKGFCLGKFPKTTEFIGLEAM